mmetsp:Transcript_28291/g.68121  ORF Transcript_28291/g.68121 Transcript_28291/m.68121 type:complete len:205 (+) Transcript_28291:629-1243(+)
MDLIICDNSTSHCHSPKGRSNGEFEGGRNFDPPSVQSWVDHIANKVSQCQDTECISVVHHGCIDDAEVFHYTTLHNEGSCHLCIGDIEWNNKTRQHDNGANTNFTLCRARLDHETFSFRPSLPTTAADCQHFMHDITRIMFRLRLDVSCRPHPEQNNAQSQHANRNEVRDDHAPLAHDRHDYPTCQGSYVNTHVEINIIALDQG